MLRTYRAILTKDRIEWQDEAPRCERPVLVQVTVLDRSPTNETPNGDAMAAALQKIADQGGITSIDDPLEWQRQVRQDRPLTGR